MHVEPVVGRPGKLVVNEESRSEERNRRTKGNIVTVDEFYSVYERPRLVSWSRTRQSSNKPLLDLTHSSIIVLQQGCNHLTSPERILPNGCLVSATGGKVSYPVAYYPCSHLLQQCCAPGHTVHASVYFTQR